MGRENVNQRAPATASMPIMIRGAKIITSALAGSKQIFHVLKTLCLTRSKDYVFLKKNTNVLHAPVRIRFRSSIEGLNILCVVVPIIVQNKLETTSLRLLCNRNKTKKHTHFTVNLSV